MWQEVVVWSVVVVAIAIAAHWSYRRVKGTCDSCDDCPEKSRCDHRKE
ncbi:MAG: hypothetical protein IKA70_04020 [Alistipes sp.]|nr:hypothetical protein [Alistipes sp.]